MARSIATVLTDILFNSELTVEAAAGKHLTDEFRLCTNGNWRTRQEFIELVSQVRSAIVDGNVEIHEELHDGDRWADRHTIVTKRHDGSVETIDAYLFGEYAADDRLVRIEELTLHGKSGEKVGRSS